MRKITSCSLAVLIWLITVSVFAQSPDLINLQGKLTDSNQTAITVPVNVTFCLYDAQSAGNLLWVEQQQNVTVNNGIFNVLLGNGTMPGTLSCSSDTLPPDFTSLSNAFNSSGDRWLEIQVNSDQPMTPRQRITSVAYSLHSNNADTATTASTANGVPWSGVTSVPAGFADGVDDTGITSETDPTVAASLKDGVDWTEVSGKPDGFADNVDDVGITTETDPQVGANATNYLSKWDGSALVSSLIYDNGNVGIGTASPGAKMDVIGSVRTTGLIGVSESDPNKFLYVRHDGSKGMIHSDFLTGGADTPLYIGTYANVGGGQLVLGTNGNITTSGNVGIGPIIPEPTTRLYISGPNPHITIDDTGITDQAYIQFKYGPVPNWWNMGVGIVSEFTPDFAISRRSDSMPETIALYIEHQTGNVGIGTYSPTYKLHVNGTAAGTSWTNLSSREYKEEIEKVSESNQTEMLAQLMKLDLATYKYKKEFGGDDTTKLGFIAEEMPKEVLSKDGKGVDVYELLTYTIGAMKAQQKEIEELKALLINLQD